MVCNGTDAECSPSHIDPVHRLCRRWIDCGYRGNWVVFVRPLDAPQTVKIILSNTIVTNEIPQAANRVVSVLRARVRVALSAVGAELLASRQLIGGSE